MMPTQAEELRTPRPEDDPVGGDDAVHTRVSELLDNATEIPDDDFLRKELLRADDEADPPRSVDANAPEEAESVEASVNLESESAAEASTYKDGSPSDGDSPEMLQGVGGEEVAAPPQSDGSASDSSKTGPTSDGQPEASSSEKSAKKRDKRHKRESKPEVDDSIAPSTVRIRGRPGGVLVEIDDDGNWKEILRLLEQRLDAAEGFFRGGKAVVEVGPRDVYEDELRQARDLLARHDMTLAVVRSTSDLTLQSSLLLGLSTSSQAEKPVESERDMAPVVPITQPKSPYFVHNGTLRSGQILRKAESIVIVGDVNPGAKVISGGDVMVWGRLRGIAYAGAMGNKGALVAAIEFAPTQLRIASVTAVPPEPRKSRGMRFWKKPEPEKRPEVAHISNGHIVVEPWDDSKPGRPRVAR